MPKGNNYPALPTEAQVKIIRDALIDLDKALAALPDLSPDLLTTATLSAERLPLADKALEVAQAAPDLMRRSFDPDRLARKLVAYRQLAGLGATLARADRKLANTLNVLGADLLFDANNVHEDVEKDKGETLDLGTLRADLHAYYRKTRKGKEGGSKGAA